MKRIIALALCISLLLSGCGSLTNSSETSSEESPITANQITDAVNLENRESLCFAENSVYTELVQTLDPEIYYVEGIESTYISKEYLEELEYNSQSNIFFGYTFAELDATFQGSRYVFTLDESGKTSVEELVTIEDETYDEIIKNVAIGTGIILFSVSVAIITKNPATSATAGRTIKFIFTTASTAATGGTKAALEFAKIGGITAVVIEAIRTNDWEKALESGLLGASEGFKFGAIFGTVKGVADGIRIVGNSRYFPEGSKQALKYPEGVEFTKAANGEVYPRFEKWAKAKAKFDKPTLKTAQNHTGLSGNYYWDSKLANAQCGFSQTPSGFVWHHLEDMQTMILVPQDLHSIAMGGMRHTGGASLIKAFLGLS